jgi:hypothetical protein
LRRTTFRFGPGLVAGASFSALEVLVQNLLSIMPLCPTSRWDPRFRKALILDGRIRLVENRTDSRAVFRDKRRLGREILDRRR